MAATDVDPAMVRESAERHAARLAGLDALGALLDRWDPVLAERWRPATRTRPR